MEATPESPVVAEGAVAAETPAPVAETAEKPAEQAAPAAAPVVDEKKEKEKADLVARFASIARKEKALREQHAVACACLQTLTDCGKPFCRCRVLVRRLRSFGKRREERASGLIQLPRHPSLDGRHFFKERLPVLERLTFTGKFLKKGAALAGKGFHLALRTGELVP